MSYRLTSFKFLLVLCFLISLSVLGIQQITPVSAQNPTPVQLPRLGALPQNPFLSTEQLIEEAFASGEITADQRLLYFYYAIYDDPRLPARFESSAPWLGTRVMRAIDRARLEIAAGRGQQYSAELRNALSPIRPQQTATLCDIDDTRVPNVITTTNFVIAYGDLQSGRVISDYVESLETSYDTLINKFGWPKYPFSQNNTFQKYPIQIAALRPGLGGYSTTGGGLYTARIGDNPNTPATETFASSSCIVLSNAYGSVGETQTVAAHELYHSIQYGVGDDSSNNDMWYESFAVYIMNEVFPTAPALSTYTWPFFRSCLDRWPTGSTNPYNNGLLFRYVSERNGGNAKAGGGEDVAEQFIRNLALKQEGVRGLALPTYDNAIRLKTPSTNLNDMFHNYAISARFAKSCPGGSPYCQ